MDKIEYIDTCSFEYRHGYFITVSESKYLNYSFMDAAIQKIKIL